MEVLWGNFCHELTALCKPAPVPTGLRGRSVRISAGRENWVVFVGLCPSLWGLKRLAGFGGNGWIRHQVGKGRSQQSCSLCQYLSSLRFPSSLSLPLFLLPSADSKCQIFWDLSVHAAVEVCGCAQSLCKMPSLDSLGGFHPKKLNLPLDISSWPTLCFYTSSASELRLIARSWKTPNTFKIQTLLNFWYHDIPSEVLAVTSVNCSSQNNNTIICLLQSWTPLLISWSILNISDYGHFYALSGFSSQSQCDATMNLVQISISAYFAYSSSFSFAP